VWLCGFDPFEQMDLVAGEFCREIGGHLWMGFLNRGWYLGLNFDS
jgi:hypothetical protein